MSARLLGGDLAPIGITTSFLRRPMHEVRDALLTWRRHELRQTVEETAAARLPGCAAVLDPLEAPWTVELILDCGEWTASINNGIGGGDPTAVAPDDDAFDGEGRGVREVVAYERRQEPLDDLRRRFGWERAGARR